MAATLQEILNCPVALQLAAQACFPPARRNNRDRARPRQPTWLCDPVVVGALGRWARFPWDLSHAMVLADRLEEMQLPIHAQDARNLFVTTIEYQRPGEAEHTVTLAEVRSLPRRLRGILLRCWRDTLVEHFGDWKNTLPCEVPADTQAERRASELLTGEATVDGG